MRTAFPTTEAAPAACPCHDSTTTTPRRARTSRRAGAGAGGGARGKERARSSGALGASMQREGAVPDSFVQKKCHAHRIFRLNKALSTKHLELLVRATLKSVIGLCGLIASRPFSAPPTCNLHPDDRMFRCFFRRCSYSTILRGWPCQPRIPAGRPPCPTAPFSTYSYPLLAHHHPSRPPLTV